MSDEEEELRQVIMAVPPVDAEARAAARAYQERLAMPPGSMGRLQAVAEQLAGISGAVKNSIRAKRIIVLCADNGVVAEGVSSAPQSVTVAQAVNMTKGLTGMSCLARHFGVDVQVVDVGMASDSGCPAVLDRHIRRGTADMALGPAMERQDCVRAVLLGVELARQAWQERISVIGVGEMGIGNTSTSTAVLSALSAVPPQSITCRGGGLTDAMLEVKKEVIARALFVNGLPSEHDDVLSVMAKVGGLDIAAMCGVFVGAARYRLPVVIDGYISIVAALCAYRLCPSSREYFFASHHSCEVGYNLAARQLNLRPFFDLEMRLGEGSACPLAFAVLESACVMMNDMATFSDARIDDTYLTELRQEGRMQ